MKHLRRKLFVAVGIGAVLIFVFFVPVAPSTITTNEWMPCALQNTFCGLNGPTSQNPSGELTYHLYSSISFSVCGIGTVYSPDPNGGLWFISWNARIC
jgi:hypothetical protein